MYEPRRLTYASVAEARLLESMGVSQSVSERLVLSDGFESEDTYTILESLIQAIKEMCENQPEQAERMRKLLSSKSEKSNEKALMQLGAVEPSKKMIDSSYLLAKAVDDLI